MYSVLNEELANVRRREAQRAAAANRLSSQALALRGDVRPRPWRLALGTKLVRFGVALAGPRADIVDLRSAFTDVEAEQAC